MSSRPNVFGHDAGPGTRAMWAEIMVRLKAEVRRQFVGSPLGSLHGGNFCPAPHARERGTVTYALRSDNKKLESGGNDDLCRAGRKGVAGGTRAAEGSAAQGAGAGT
jgi:hypothetical protein